MDRDVVAHEQAVAAFLMITVGAAGIMINGYVLYGVLVHKAFGKVFGAICASQILANLGNSFVFAVLVGPISIIDFDFHKTYWGTRCGQLLVIFWNASLLSHLLTSVNRCANVLLPCKQTENVFSPKLTHYLIAFTWIFALCQGIPYFLPACTLEFSAAQFKFNFHETDCKPYLYYYADYYYSIIVVSLIAMVDICTVLQIRSLQKKKILHKKSKDVKFFFQALIQAIITMTELVVYFWLSSLFANNKWAYFYATTLIWIVEECCDGVVFIVFNKDIRHRSIRMNNFSLEFLNGLLEWTKTLGVTETVESVSSGCGIARCLHRIDSQFFSDEWLRGTEGVKHDDNFRMKTNNIRKVTRKIEDYYDKVLKRQFNPEKWFVDSAKIGELQDHTHIGRLLVLTLSVATLGPRSEEFVKQLSDLQLSTHVQKELMTIMWKIDRDMPDCGRGDLNHSETGQALRSVNDLKNDNARLNVMIDSCKAEIRALKSENEDLLSQLDESNAKLVDLDVAQQEVLNYRNIVSRLKDHGRRMDDICYEKELEEQTLRDEISRCREIIKKFEDSKEDELISHLKDENLNLSTQVQVLSERLEAAELRVPEIEGLRLRLKDVNTLRSENKVLREKLDSYIPTAVELEDERRINEDLKAKFEELKLNMSDVEVRLVAETVRAEQAECELAKAKMKLEEMEAIKNELIVEQVRLKEEIADRGTPSLAHDLEISGYDPTTLEPLTVDERIQLKMETERLRSTIEESQKERCKLKEEFERQISELHAELRISKDQLAQEQLLLAKLYAERSTDSSAATSSCLADSSRKCSSIFASTSTWILIAFVSILIPTVLYVLFNQQRTDTWKRSFVPT